MKKLFLVIYIISTFSHAQDEIKHVVVTDDTYTFLESDLAASKPHIFTSTNITVTMPQTSLTAFTFLSIKLLKEDSILTIIPDTGVNFGTNQENEQIVFDNSGLANGGDAISLYSYIDDQWDIWKGNDNITLNSITPNSEITSLIGNYTSSSIVCSGETENSNVTGWTDLINGNNLTITNGQPVLHIGNNGKKQIRFDGIDDLMAVASNTIYNFTPQNDEFTILVKFGDIIGSSSVPFIGKAYVNDSTTQFSIAPNGGRWSNRAFGSGNNAYSPDPEPNDVVAFVVSLYASEFYVNNVLAATSEIGNATNSENFRIGGRSNAFAKGDIESIRIYNTALTPQEVIDEANKLN